MKFIAFHAALFRIERQADGKAYRAQQEISAMATYARRSLGQRVRRERERATAHPVANNERKEYAQSA